MDGYFLGIVQNVKFCELLKALGLNPKLNPTYVAKDSNVRKDFVESQLPPANYEVKKGADVNLYYNTVSPFAETVKKLPHGVKLTDILRRNTLGLYEKEYTSHPIANSPLPYYRQSSYYNPYFPYYFIHLQPYEYHYRLPKNLSQGYIPVQAYNGVPYFLPRMYFPHL
ncbi:hypothetical protein ACJ2A9_17305 [Anaerobacillus sp. MEB173]|uniref:hypothetical protein n=1 Tax=Anaerobacillus sp. MEB173 TaxID=3383345 RepID=UPI003F8F89C8